MSFQGFGEYAIDFYDGLVVDNSKSYWDANKATYESDVKAPMKALLSELEPEFAEGLGPGKVFRPFRDVRFAKDKSPYKTHCGGVIEAGRGGGAYYVEVGPDGLRVGGGCFHLAPDQLARYRQAVDTGGAELRAILGTLRKQGFAVEGDQMRTAPRGFAKDHEQIDLLRHRSVYAVKVWEPDDALHGRETFARVRKAWQQLRPFNDWARHRVGAHTDSA
ncbi:DUF2461 domain-containing protein [Actinokineospora guangxiensis]|uniref:DUF2461 domain-containing protein n=1 Tax=Actinokineospora guangxiensis TaxID=1490288 RepID=A0ABW0ENZ1_9PSEU